MKMKAIRMLGTLAMTAAVAMVVGACSSDDNLVDNGADNGSTAARSVTVTVGAGIADDAATRSAVVNGTDAETGKPTHTLKFTTGDKLYVYGEIDNNNYKSGMLTMVGEPTNDGKDATFRGELTTSGVLLPATDEDLLTGTTATLIHEGMKSIDDDPDDYDYGFYKGIIYFNDGYAKDLETLMTKRLKVTGEYDNGGYTLAASDRDAIFNCTFTGLEAEEKYELSLQYEREPNNMVGLFNYYFTTDKYGNGTIAFSSMEVGEQSWEINIKGVGIIKLYDPTVGMRELEAGKIYNVRRWWNGTAFASPTNLADITTDHVAQNGEILTGKLGAAHKISIADGATVTLAGVTIDGNTLGGWVHLAGINCLGDATIILADGTTNTVTNFHMYYPCIHVPEGNTLTIRGGSEGTGKLIAENLDFGAGIGGGNDISCGNIVIEGGNIVATSKNDAAGIGAGCNSSCGNITITGGKVTAKGGDSAGIGCGMGIDEQERSVCGAITIYRGEGFVSVTAIKGEYMERPIGITYSEFSSCGIIKFNGCTIYDGNGYYENIGDGFKYYPNDEIWVGWLQLSITSSDPDDPDKRDVWTLTPCESDY